MEKSCKNIYLYKHGKCRILSALPFSKSRFVKGPMHFFHFVIFVRVPDILVYLVARFTCQVDFASQISFFKSVPFGFHNYILSLYETFFHAKKFNGKFDFFQKRT